MDHYRQFLRRELAALAEVDAWYSTGATANGDAVAALIGGMGENDRRFLNLYLLECLHRQLTRSRRWGHCPFKSDKNLRSGVWLAVYRAEGEIGRFQYVDSLTALWEQYGVDVYFQIELRDRALATVEGEVAGAIQLRCNVKRNPKEMAAKFRALRPLLEGEKYPSRIADDVGSFYLLSRPLLKADLTAKQFGHQLDLFAESLGRFNDEPTALPG